MTERTYAQIWFFMGFACIEVSLWHWFGWAAALFVFGLFLFAAGVVGIREFKE